MNKNSKTKKSYTLYSRSFSNLVDIRLMTKAEATACNNDRRADKMLGRWVLTSKIKK